MSGTPRRPSAVDSSPYCVRRICERITQPIRLVFPDLFQDRLAKLTEHAAHVDMIMGAVAQHDLWIAPVAQCLQRQPVGVLQPVDRTLDGARLQPDGAALTANIYLTLRSCSRQHYLAEPLPGW